MKELFMQSPGELTSIVAWGMLYQRDGCIVCQSKVAIHAGYGFCLDCAKDRLAKWDKINSPER